MRSKPTGRGVRHRGLPETISKITDRVLDELGNWQNRPLDRVYPVISMSSFGVNIATGLLSLGWLGRNLQLREGLWVPETLSWLVKLQFGTR